MGPEQEPEKGLSGVMNYLGKQIYDIFSGDMVPPNHLDEMDRPRSPSGEVFGMRGPNYENQVTENDADPNRMSAEFGGRGENFVVKNRGIATQKAQGTKYDRHSAETKASSSQREQRIFGARNPQQLDGYTPNEALEVYGAHLTEFEKIEITMHERIYTIGKVRRHN